MSDAPAGATASRSARAGSLILLAGIGLYATWFSWGIGLWRGGSPGEGLFPFFAALAVTLLSLIGLAGLMLEARAADTGSRLSTEARRRLGFYIAALFFYGGTLELLGFFVSTILSLTFILRVAERYSWRMTLALVAGTVIGSYPDLFTLTWPEQSWRRLDERDGDAACIV
jgi:hypothetical protein